MLFPFTQNAVSVFIRLGFAHRKKQEANNTYDASWTEGGRGGEGDGDTVSMELHTKTSDHDICMEDLSLSPSNDHESPSKIMGQGILVN